VAVWVLAIGAVVATLAWLPEPPGLGGSRHPDLASMRQGGEESGALLGVGWTFGCCIILCFSALVHFGALRGPGRARLAWFLRAVTALYLGAWTWLIWTYRAGLGAADPELVMAVPAATAIMLWVFWPISMLFSLLFVVGYRRWVLTPEEESAFAALVRDHRSPK
jgi:hypothetical protein